jgi:hypothetical protein
MHLAFTRLLGAGCLALAIAGPARAAIANEALPTVSLSINGHKIVVEVAATPERRALGPDAPLQPAADHGMLFAFERPGAPGVLDEEHVHSSVDRVRRRGREDHQHRRDAAAGREHAVASRGPAL